MDITQSTDALRHPDPVTDRVLERIGQAFGPHFSSWHEKTRLGFVDEIVAIVKNTTDETERDRARLKAASDAARIADLERQVAELGAVGDRLQLIHRELHAAGLTAAGANPLDPLESVKHLIEDRSELLEEMARGAEPEQVAAAVSELADQAERGEDVPWRPDPASDHAEAFPVALRATHDALIAVITASERDWSRSADLAWIHGVIVGWSADDLEVLQVSFGWRDNTVQVINEHRAALVAAGIVE